MARKFGEDRFGGRLDSASLLDVAGNRDGTPSTRSPRPLLRRPRLSRSTQATVGAGLREGQRNSAADAVAGAGDDGGFAGERIFAGERHETCRRGAAAEIGLMHARIWLELGAGARSR